MQHLYTGVTWRRDVASRVVYLTFDDGPIPRVTPAILDLLARHDAKATFFCVGDNIRKHPDLFQRIIDEGHAVGNHTYHHVAGWQTPTATYLSEVEQCDNQMRAFGVEPRLFRPPYGRMRHSQKKAVALTHEVVMWDVLTHDYNKRYTPRDLVEIVKRYTRQGSILNFHDSIKSEKQVLGSLDEIIDWLRSEDYRLLTL